MDNAPMTPSMGTNPNPLPSPAMPAPGLMNQTATPTPSAPSLAMPAAPAPTGPAMPPSIPPEPKKSSPMLIIIILVVVLVLAGAGFFIWQSMQTPEVTIDPSPNRMPAPNTQLERPVPVEEILPEEAITLPASEDSGPQIEVFPAEELGANGEMSAQFGADSEVTTQPLFE